ncbi:MAG: CDP-alcohol phosphatidyltransferase family protein [Candidatus Kaiserbacteria bacterium]|nr:CDP-alcohol phosphatidyltransferase family protein [Candidatus Kaiserbacteria bacterium]
MTSNPLQMGFLSYLRSEVCTIANAITSVRLICALALYAFPELAAVAFLAALIGAVSDAIDGPVAKWTRRCTSFGKRFDQWVDWFFGIALMYAILVHDRFTVNTISLTVVIGAYMLLRLRVPTADTSSAARIKTILQFTAGPVILSGHAAPEIGQFLFGDRIEIPAIASALWYAGYAIVWTSTLWTWYSFRDYFVHP